MICKIFKRGRGKASGIDYLLNHKDATGQFRTPPAELIRGDINLSKTLISHVPFAQKYTSGVLSWEEHPDEINEQTIQSVMDSFEQMVNVGLESDRLNWLWVKHQDKGRLELHFVIPNQDLQTGKRFAPYFHRTDLKRFRAWERLTNAKHGFTNPNDLSKKQSLSLPPNLPSNKKESLEQIHLYVKTMVNQRKINNRIELINTLKNRGYKVNRSGKNYISIQDSSGKRMRLKGSYYEDSFKGLSSLNPAPENKSPKQDIKQLEEDLNIQLEKRRNYISSRFKQRNPSELETLTSTRLTTNNNKENNNCDRTRTASNQHSGESTSSYGLEAQAFNRSTSELKRSIRSFCSVTRSVIERFRLKLSYLSIEKNNINFY